MDGVATLLATGYGVFMGSYPVPIKAPQVRAANVHPIVFQNYKSFWVFVTGLLFAIPVFARGEKLHLTWWAIASAACWVPSGTLTIASVMLNGVSLSIVINAASAAVGSFLVFWLLSPSSVKTHDIGGHRVAFAPFYLAGCVLGMVALVYGPLLPSRCAKPPSSRATLHSGPLLDPLDREQVGGGVDEGGEGEGGALEKLQGGGAGGAGGGRRELLRYVLGIVLAVFAGLLGAAQYAVISIGKGIEYKRHGCEHNHTLCPAELTQAFDPLGAWSVMFGFGAMGVAGVLLLLLAAFRRLNGHALPSLELRVMAVPGSMAGLLWVAGNLGGELAVLKGGNAIEVPTMTAIQLIVSGAWGIVWYREVSGRCEVAIWVLAALWTLAMILLLGMERA
jgi:hypothetical protein